MRDLRGNPVTVVTLYVEGYDMEEVVQGICESALHNAGIDLVDERNIDDSDDFEED